MMTSLMLILFLLFSAEARSPRIIVFPVEASSAMVNYLCEMPANQERRCVPVTECPFLLRLKDFDRLRMYLCGFHRDEPQVCCPTSTEWLIGITPLPAITTKDEISSTSMPPVLHSPNLHRVETPSLLPRECGISKAVHIRYAVRQTTRDAWPWMAVVYQAKSGLRNTECGGALVTSNYVITSAQCVVDSNVQPLDPKSLFVRIGDHDLSDDEDNAGAVDIAVLSVVSHQLYDSQTHKNDIALLRLAQHVKFGRSIQPICLPFESFPRDGHLNGRRSFLSGWGNTASKNLSSPVLKDLNFHITDQEICRKVYENLIPITNEYICGGLLDGSNDSCLGDLGGPLMLPGKNRRWYLIGILSFGKLCSKPGYPVLYTRVTEYLDWLKDNLL